MLSAGTARPSAGTALHFTRARMKFKRTLAEHIRAPGYLELGPKSSPWFCKAIGLGSPLGSLGASCAEIDGLVGAKSGTRKMVLRRMVPKDKSQKLMILGVEPAPSLRETH